MRTRKLADAITESAQTNSTVTVEVDDIESAHLDLLASEYEIDAEPVRTVDGAGIPRVSRIVRGWTDATPEGETEWTLRLVRA